MEEVILLEYLTEKIQILQDFDFFLTESQIHILSKMKTESEIDNYVRPLLIKHIDSYEGNQKKLIHGDKITIQGIPCIVLKKEIFIDHIMSFKVGVSVNFWEVSAIDGVIYEYPYIFEKVIKDSKEYLNIEDTSGIIDSLVTPYSCLEKKWKIDLTLDEFFFNIDSEDFYLFAVEIGNPK